MRGFRLASLCLSVAATAWSATTDQPLGRTDAATMDPYLPIRNSALQFELGGAMVSVPSYYAKDDDAKASGTKAVSYNSAGSLTQVNLRIRHGFVASTEAILDVPYILASGDARRPNPAKKNDGSSGTITALGGTDTSASGFGDWTMGVKSCYEPWGLGFYFALVLPVGEALGSGAYTNGDGQLNAGLLWDKTFKEKFDVMTNFVYGYDLPATNRQLDKQDSYSGYFRFSYLLQEKKYRPYLALTYKGYGDYVIDKQTTASSSYQLLVTPGVDLNLAGDFSAELLADVIVAGSGNGTIATNGGYKLSATLKYFWFRF